MSEKAHLVLVEDDESNRRGFVRALTREGYRVEAFGSAEPAIEHLRAHRDVALLVTDLLLPGLDGLGLLERVREIDPELGVLMITGHASVDSAVEAMKRGASDYLQKPVHLDELRTRVARLVERRSLSKRVVDLERRLKEKFGRIVGRSKAMEELFRQIELVAPTRSSVLVIGESGTGKELVANALHENSPNREGRFVAINCAAIPAEILESELFGHERGAFTGATARRVGQFEMAHRGTLFLDEIGELPLDMQVKLLRVLEEREFLRVGGSETIRVDIRLVAATNRDLAAAVEAGRFRSDLYYRIKVVTLRIPPLRERREDIPLLVQHFLATFARENDRDGLRMSPEAMRALYAARWEGNVRELRNLVESLVVLAPSDVIRLEDLPAEYRHAVEEPDGSPAAEPSRAGPRAGDVLTMEEIERRAIIDALDKTGGNRTQAAERLGIGLRTLQRKLKEYRLASRE